VVLGRNGANVTYNMICSEVKIRELRFTARKTHWTAIDQPADDIWGFKASVDLRFEVGGAGAINALPPDIQEKIRNTGGDAFSIQQLLFDLDNAGLQGSPAVTVNGKTKEQSDNLSPEAATYFDHTFLSLYYGQMQKEGQPLLHVAVTTHNEEISDFRASKINLHINPLVNDSGVPLENTTTSQQQLTTLNYVATCFGRQDLPKSPSTFAWNWVTENEATQWHGVMAINRKSFSTWLKDQLWGQAKSSCWDFHVRTPVENLQMVIHLEWENKKEPTHTYHDTGDKLFDIDYKQQKGHNLDGAGAQDISGHYGLGYCEITPEYHCTVSVSGNIITIVQHVWVDVWIIKGTTPSQGHYLDRRREDQYILKANATGGLKVELKNISEKNEDNNPQAGWFTNAFTNLNSTTEWVKGVLGEHVAPELTKFPLSIAQDFHFPGGKVFAFKNVEFSDHQDLTATITYVEAHK
jgi:hypothetical protein